MRRLIIHTLASLDGVVDDPPAWGSRDYRDDESTRDDTGEVMACEAMLFGRRSYQALFPIFGPRTDPWAARINAMTKHVFSSTLRDTPWQNSVLVPGDACAAVEQLKRADGGDLLVYGYTRFAETLLRRGLVDVLRVSLFPVLVGRGGQLFREGATARMNLVSTKTYARGAVLLTYGMM